MRSINDILTFYRRPEDRELISRAYAVAEGAHEGQERKSGGPYIVHPLETAYTLAEMRMDPPTIAAALLHDTIEDTNITPKDIEEEFGKEIAFLVEGVTKLGKVKYVDSTEDAENLRKMLLAMAEDIRVVLIKCADRLHNMKTLSALAKDKQQRKALETMEIYAPISSRLGIWEIAKELEDLAFPYLDPVAYATIAKEMQKRIPEREEYLKRVEPILRQALKEEDIKPLTIQTRSKNIYSVHKKLQKYEGNWGVIHDLAAARIIVESVSDCYAALGVIHKLWHPYPGRIKDYIALPKVNGYQSLHTTVFCLDGITAEFQIRTLDMHDHAEHGVAAHWAYNEKGKESTKVASKERAKFSWVSKIRDWQREMPESEEFLEAMKIDLFRDRIFVLTPRGEIIDLPEAATPVDFAYSIHSLLGHECGGARVNGKYVPLSYELKNGDVVEIERAKGRAPSHAWLEFVKTNQARSHIRAWFKRANKTENARRGRELVDRELREGYNTSWAQIANTRKKETLAQFPHSTLEDLLAGVGAGEVSLQRVIRRLIDEGDALPSAPATQHPIYSSGKILARGNVQIAGQQGIRTRLAQCCKPIPGEQITAYVTKVGTAAVHKKSCAYVALYTRTKNAQLFPAQWEENVRTEAVPITLTIHGQDRVGLLQDIASMISELGVNMRSFNAGQANQQDGRVVLTATIEIRSLQELQRVRRKLKTVRSVEEVRRT